MSTDSVSKINELNGFSVEMDNDGIAVVTVDQKERAMNVIGDKFIEELEVVADAITNDESVKGVVLTSAKKGTFIVGGDIDMMAGIHTVEDAFNMVEGMKRGLRKLELSGKPVAAAINGMALGGGLEVALGCHYRVGMDNPKAKVGLPEVKLGLLPGGGGTQRMLRLVGMQKSIELITQGKELRPQKALELGIIDELASDNDDLINKAKAWVKSNPEAKQPWDKKGYRIPGGDGHNVKLVQQLSIAPAMAYQKSHGNHPAITHILSCIYEGSLLQFDPACELESRYFAACVNSSQAKNMINTLWIQLNRIKKGQSRPDGFEQYTTKKVGILGAGMMGAGIAYITAKNGMDVVLLDRDMDSANNGKGYSEKLLDKAISRKRSTEEKKQALLDKIKTTTSYDDLEGCDLIIEAVFEDRDIKAECTKKSEAVIPETAIFASNTSTLPITGLAKASDRPANFIGLHFFSPVDKMPLVEIIVGEQTSDETLARSFDYVLQIGKTPIVVNDSRGFYTSRVFGTYVYEGLAMLQEGVNPRSIEVAGSKAGMPMPPLALQDEVSLGLSMHVIDQNEKDADAEGRPHDVIPGKEALYKVGRDLDRLGRKAGKGFYDYHEDGSKSLWSGLSEHFPVAEDQPAFEDLVDRFLYTQANESAKVFQEGVVRSVADTNIGSIFGWGFAPHQGGTLQFINSEGLSEFVERSRELAKKYGERFEPAQIIVDKAEKGEVFQDDV